MSKFGFALETKEAAKISFPDNVAFLGNANGQMIVTGKIYGWPDDSYGSLSAVMVWANKQDDILRFTPVDIVDAEEEGAFPLENPTGQNAFVVFP